jgi:hypothetical protein
MASFAKIGLNGKVIAVHSVVNEVLHDSNGVEREDIGIDFLTKLHGWAIWKQTSYNTIGGVHTNGGTPLRKNLQELDILMMKIEMPLFQKNLSIVGY